MTASPACDQNSTVSTTVNPVTVDADTAVKKAMRKPAPIPSAAAIGEASKIPPSRLSPRNTPSKSSGVDVQRRAGTRGWLVTQTRSQRRSRPPLPAPAGNRRLTGGSCANGLASVSEVWIE